MIKSSKEIEETELSSNFDEKTKMIGSSKKDYSKLNSKSRSKSNVPGVDFISDLLLKYNRSFVFLLGF